MFINQYTFKATPERVLGGCASEIYARKTVLSRIRENYIAPERERGGRVKAKNRKEEKKGILSGQATIFAVTQVYNLRVCSPPDIDVPSPSSQNLPFFLLCHLSGNPLHSDPTFTSVT